MRGPWLDEFCTLQLSDTRQGLAVLVREGWLRDAHPPLFNAWATFVSSLGFSSIPAGRLAGNLPAVALMVLAAWRLARRDPAHAAFAAALLLLVLSLPDTMDVFATWRSYFWQVAAVATLALVGRHVMSSGRDLDWRRDLDLAAIAAVASFVSIGLHYVGGLFGGLLSLGLAGTAFAAGHRRWALLFAVSAGLGAAFIAGSVALQLPSWAEQFDHSWIGDTTFREAALIPPLLIAVAILHNPVPLLALLPGLAGRMRRGRPFLKPDRRYVVLIVSVIAVGLAIVLVAHLFKPMVVDRYLIAVPVLVCAALAVPAARLADDRSLLGRRLFAAMAAVAVAVAALPLIQSGIRPVWNENAETIRRIVAACPATQVYAASGWVPGPVAETRAAQREEPVFERAYRSLAASHGFRFRYLPIGGTAHARPGPCPVLVWFEHTPNDAENDPRGAIEEAGLRGLDGALVTAIRSPTGFIVRADRDTSLSALP